MPYYIVVIVLNWVKWKLLKHPLLTKCAGVLCLQYLPILKHGNVETMYFGTFSDGHNWLSLTWIKTSFSKTWILVPSRDLLVIVVSIWSNCRWLLTWQGVAAKEVTDLVSPKVTFQNIAAVTLGCFFFTWDASHKVPKFHRHMKLTKCCL